MGAGASPWPNAKSDWKAMTQPPQVYSAAAPSTETAAQTWCLAGWLSGDGLQWSVLRCVASRRSASSSSSSVSPCITFCFNNKAGNQPLQQ